MPTVISVDILMKVENMQFYKLDSFIGGWFIGNFDKSVLKTDLVEVSYKKHPKNEKWPRHYHAIATEYNALLRGKMQMISWGRMEITNGNIYQCNPGDIFVVRPMETVQPIFQEDCELIVVKIPSLPGDKYEI